MKFESFIVFQTFTVVIFAGKYCLKASFNKPSCSDGFILPVTPIDVDVVATRTECAVRCFNDPSCFSINVCTNTTGGHLCQRLESVSNESCSYLHPVPGCVHLHQNNVCQNHGVYNYSLMQCDCPDDYTGTYCERRYQDCSEAYRGGVRGLDSDSNRNMHIQPVNCPTEFLVECYLDFGGWTTVLKRVINCPTDSNITWDEYKVGWITPCFRWLGLETLHYLTNQVGFKGVLDVMIGFAPNLNGHYYYGELTIGNEASSFTLHYETEHGHPNSVIADGFAFGGASKSIKGKSFATSDRPDPQGCAVSAGAGWWYGDQCPDTNLHKTMTTNGASTNIAEWPDGNGTLKRVTYMLMQLKVEPIP